MGLCEATILQVVSLYYKVTVSHPISTSRLWEGGLTSTAYELGYHPIRLR